MIVMKFGGTSVGNAERIRNVADIVKSYIKRKPIVVVSAVTKITDSLIKLANECSQGRGDAALNSIKKAHYEILEQLKLNEKIIEKDIGELSILVNKAESGKINAIDAKTLDYFQSFGERMSSKIVAAQLSNIGVKSIAFNSWELGFLTNSEFGNAEPLEVSYSNIKNRIKELDAMPVITGFIGKTEQGEITTLGRGGSDYTAAIIGSALNAEEIQIWTDVDGIMSTDPKMVSNAKKIDRVSFAEASELAYFGARVLHPKTILPAMRKNIPVRVLNSFNIASGGTLIVNKAESKNVSVKAIARKKDITLISINSTRMLGAYGFLAVIFNIFNKYKKSVDVVATSEVSVSLSVDNDSNIEYILNELANIGEVKIAKGKAIICVVGEGLAHVPGIAGTIFSTLGKSNVNVEMISFGASKINVTFIVDGKDAERSVKVLHKEYFG